MAVYWSTLFVVATFNISTTPTANVSAPLGTMPMVGGGTTRVVVSPLFRKITPVKSNEPR
jgi:hypothetical protein